MMDETGIVVIHTNEEGLITKCESTVALVTTANKFAIGCEMLGNDGKNYTNIGTVAVPEWQDEGVILADEIDASVLKVVEIPLTSADIKGMFAAPITVVPAVSGKTIIVDEATIKFTPGAVAYTGGGDIMVGTADANCITAIPKALILSVADGTALTSTAKGIDISVNEAAGLDLSLTNADAAFATGTVGGSIVIRYHLV